MTSNISKWFPKTVKNNDKVFERTKHIERELRILGKKFATNINFNLLDYYVSVCLCFLVLVLISAFILYLSVFGTVCASAFSIPKKKKEKRKRKHLNIPPAFPFSTLITFLANYFLPPFSILLFSTFTPH